MQWATDVDWPELATVLRWRRLLPTLGPRIHELAGEHASDEFCSTVDESREAGLRQSALLEFVSSHVSSALADAGVRSTSLKGPLLSTELYGDPGRRLSSDVDLLVAPEELDAAVQVVRTLGYSAPNDHVDAHGLPLLHFALVHERGELPPVELHWRIHWYERRFASDRLLAPDTTDPAGDWRPERADELAALLLFYARDGFIDLRLATDLGAWWDAFGDGIPPGAMDELFNRYPALVRVLTVSGKVAQEIVGLPVERIVRRMPKQRIRDLAASRLANPNPHASRSQLYADRGLIDGLLMPPGGCVAFIRRQIFLPRTVLEERAGRSPERRLRSRLGRNGRLLIRCGVLGRYGLAMTRAVRARETIA